MRCISYHLENGVQENIHTKLEVKCFENTVNSKLGKQKIVCYNKYDSWLENRYYQQ